MLYDRKRQASCTRKVMPADAMLFLKFLNQIFSIYHVKYWMSIFLKKSPTSPEFLSTTQRILVVALVMKIFATGSIYSLYTFVIPYVIFSNSLYSNQSGKCGVLIYPQGNAMDCLDFQLVSMQQQLQVSCLTTLLLIIILILSLFTFCFREPMVLLPQTQFLVQNSGIMSALT